MQEMLLIIFGVIGGFSFARIIQDKINHKMDKRFNALNEKQKRFDLMPTDIKKLQSEYETALDYQWLMICELHEDPNRIPPTLIKLKKDLEIFCIQKNKENK